MKGRMFMMVLIVSTLSVPAMGQGVTIGRGPAPKESGARDVRKALVEAIKKLARIDVAMSGDLGIEGEAATNESTGRGGNFSQMIAQAAPRDFSGKFDAIRSKHGESVVVTHRQIPGIAAFRRGEKALNQHTFSSEKVSSKRFVEIVSQMTDWASLARAVGESKKVTADSRDGRSLTCVLSPSYLVNEVEELSKKRAVMMTMDDLVKVMGLACTFTLDEKGDVKAMKCVVQYSTPPLPFSGGQLIVTGGDGESMGSDPKPTPGKKFSVTLKRVPQASKSVLDFLERARKLL